MGTVRLHDRRNLGPYRAAFASDHAAFDDAVDALGKTLCELDGATRPPGPDITIADILLFVTAVRWDAAYHGAFQLLTLCWRDFLNLQAHLEAMLDRPELAASVDVAGYRMHYFDDNAFPIRHPTASGLYIVPRAPEPRANARPGTDDERDRSQA